MRIHRVDRALRVFQILSFLIPLLAGCVSSPGQPAVTTVSNSAALPVKGLSTTPSTTPEPAKPTPDILAFSVPRRQQSSKYAMSAGGPTSAEDGGMEHPVRVLFGGQTYSMLFRPPGTAGFEMPSGLTYNNEWTETSINNDCYEVAFNLKSVMWIEENTPARMLVRFRGQLLNDHGLVAHEGVPSDSPYGAGDWADEWFSIYPDGVVARHVVIYTGMTWNAVAFWGRDGTIFETQETMIRTARHDSQPVQDVELTALTLVNMRGESRDINFKPYPPDRELFNGANMQIVNLKGGYFPFTIAPAGNVEIRPYAGATQDMGRVDEQTFVAWPRGDSFPYGYTSSLTHVINWNWYRKGEKTLEQVYLTGMLLQPEQADRVAQLMQISHAWQTPPELQSVDRKVGYLMEERAYQLDGPWNASAGLHFTLNGSAQQPVWDPVLRLKGGRGLRVDAVQVNGGKALEGFHYGPSGDDLILWLPYQSQDITQVDVKFGTEK